MSLSNDIALDRIYTASEAHAFTGVSKKRIKKEKEFKIITNRKLLFEDLVYLNIIRICPHDLSVPMRKELKESLEEFFRGESSGVQVGGVFDINISKHCINLAEHIAKIITWIESLTPIVEHHTQYLYIEGTRVHVKQIYTITDPRDLEDLRKANHELSDDDIEYAKIYHAAYPRR